MGFANNLLGFSIMIFFNHPIFSLLLNLFVAKSMNNCLKVVEEGQVLNLKDQIEKYKKHKKH